jgi:AraC-like DNA-binding protein
MADYCTGAAFLCEKVKLTIVGRLARHVSQPIVFFLKARAFKKSRTHDRYTCRALKALHARPFVQWTVETLAREVGLSRSALVRRFHRLLGMSPYLSKWRLHLAAQALREDRENIAAIAEQVGYGSEEAFGRAFTRCFGSSPAAWRKSQA